MFRNKFEFPYRTLVFIMYVVALVTSFPTYAETTLHSSTDYVGVIDAKCDNWHVAINKSVTKVTIYDDEGEVLFENELTPSNDTLFSVLNYDGQSSQISVTVKSDHKIVGTIDINMCQDGYNTTFWLEREGK